MKVATLLFVVAAGPIGLAAQSVRGRLQGRVPESAIAAVDSLVRAAEMESLPSDPLVKKALEGGAKGVSADRIVLAVRQTAGQLHDARALLRRGQAGEPSADEIASVAAALGRGVPTPLGERMASALPGEPMGPALHAVADLVGHGFAQDSAVDLVVTAGQKGMRGLRLLDVASAAVAELQRGRTHAQAIADVRGGLPDVPSAPPAAPGVLNRLRRPPQGVRSPS